MDETFKNDSIQKSMKKMTPFQCTLHRMMVETSVPLQIFFRDDKEDVPSSQKDQKSKDPGKAKTIFFTHLKENSKGN